MFKKPGPATSIVSIFLLFKITNFFILLANSKGLIPFVLPNIKAIFEDKSKSNSCGGLSTVIPLKLFN